MPDASLSIDGTTVISKTGGNISIDNFNSASGKLTGATFPAGMPIRVYNKTMARGEASGVSGNADYSQSTSYFEEQLVLAIH